MRELVMLQRPWAEPIEVLGPLAGEPHAFALLGSAWSYLALQPDEVLTIPAGATGLEPFQRLAQLVGEAVPPDDGAPPFSGGVAGLAGYGLGRFVERVDPGDFEGWPDAVFARYPAVLAFDHSRRRVVACGRGPSRAAAGLAAETAAGWLASNRAPKFGGQLCEALEADDPAAFEQAVEDVRGRIAAGDIFQANVARRWKGRLAAGAGPFDVFRALVRASPAPMAGYFSLPGRAVVSNSPEQFVAVTEGQVVTRPIKGTAPRGGDAAHDLALAQALSTSPKDRAENLMIVDLMRNDLSRVCRPGSVAAPVFCALETFANVHHLVSTVTGTLRPDASVPDLLRAVFPPGSITGAPKVEAMKVIAALEPPRGPFFGSLFWAGPDGGFDSSVLIRTLALRQDTDGWRFEARAGGGITADSDPVAERRETEDKIAAIARALTEVQ